MVSQPHRSSARHQRGFTLIELLVVVTIVGLLAGIAVLNVRHAHKKAAENVLRADLATMRKAIDDFYADRQRFPTSLQELVDLNYLRFIPKDPITDSAETWIEVPVDPSDESLPAPTDSSAGPGIIDVKSGAEGETLDHVPYGEL
ncbi:MAG TPA: prepilin-type N-terminal cleavage/methylation domain-containing protein [Thermoanaerobaculia bacterium]|nr:prepilin-type N-terminal cleavage/methylation domain-containing protein [Thermoanaerobaculia bacterium]